MSKPEKRFGRSSGLPSTGARGSQSRFDRMRPVEPRPEDKVAKYVAPSVYDATSKDVPPAKDRTSQRPTTSTTMPSGLTREPVRQTQKVPATKGEEKKNGWKGEKIDIYSGKVVPRVVSAPRRLHNDSKDADDIL